MKKSNGNWIGKDGKRETGNARSPHRLAAQTHETTASSRSSVPSLSSSPPLPCSPSALLPLSPASLEEAGAAASSVSRFPSSSSSGFTLIELIVVVAIIGILAAIAVPAMKNAPKKAKEAALKENLFTMRSCIDQYLADKGKYPPSLEVLVDEHYMRRIPVDPITGFDDSWVTVPAAPDTDEDLQPEEGGIIDVHSGSEGIALDGTSYADW